MLTIAAVSAAMSRAWTWIRSRRNGGGQIVRPLTWDELSQQRQASLGGDAERIPCSCPVCRAARRKSA